jgi:CubicO group peptidase (beta-lactamase class C family)
MGLPVHPRTGVLVAVVLLVAAHGTAWARVSPHDLTGRLLRMAMTPVTMPAAAEPRALREPPSLAANAGSAVSSAAGWFEGGAAHAMNMVDGAAIVFEAYKDPANAQTPLHGYSVSKTLTAVAVGVALCAGHIKSLDDPASVYAKELEGTIYGQASVRQLLTMSIGAVRAPFG